MTAQYRTIGGLCVDYFGIVCQKIEVVKFRTIAVDLAFGPKHPCLSVSVDYFSFGRNDEGRVEKPVFDEVRFYSLGTCNNVPRIDLRNWSILNVILENLLACQVSSPGRLFSAEWGGGSGRAGEAC